MPSNIQDMAKARLVCRSSRDTNLATKTVLKPVVQCPITRNRLFRDDDTKHSVEAAIERVKTLIAEEKNLSPALKSSLEVLLLLVALM